MESGEGEELLTARAGKEGVNNRAASASSAAGEGDLGGGGGDLGRPRGNGEMVRAGDGETGFR